MTTARCGVGWGVSRNERYEVGEGRDRDTDTDTITEIETDR